MTTRAYPKVALLFQAAAPPAVDGINKPMKPGGYQDSCADIACALRANGTTVVTPRSEPDLTEEADWSFPDTESGILDALSKGATHLWANTVVFASHPLQTSSRLHDLAESVLVVGQPCQLVDSYDDKNLVNTMLRKDGRFIVPRGWVVDSANPRILSKLTYPIVGKPIRGRGSYGVKVCHSEEDLRQHLAELLAESSQVMIEEFLEGQEGTVTVLPPAAQGSGYRALPIVVRFDHQEGVAPYNGIVAVTQNSRVPTDEEFVATPGYETVQRQCELVAEKLRVTAPIRIDVRQAQDKADAPFAIFDVNMKPNMTGPGRPGRERQASLSALAASKLGWAYPELLQRILKSAQPLQHLRNMAI